MTTQLSGPIPPHPYYDKNDQSLYIEKKVPKVRPEADEYYQKGTRGSHSNGPIPPHPYYDKTDQSIYLETRVPKVRLGGESIYQHGVTGTVGMLLALDGEQVAVSQKPKPKPKNHLNENVRRMRQIQRDARLKEKEVESAAPVPVKALWKSSQYESVPSKLKEFLSQPPQAPRPHTAEFLRSHSSTGWAYDAESRPASTYPLDLEKVGKDKENHTEQRAQTAREPRAARKEIDFVRMNSRGVKNVPFKRAPSVTALDEQKKQQEEKLAAYKKGEVPQYIIKRREQMVKEAEERKANAPDPDLPPGHRLMPEQERVQTLDKLKQTEKELIKQMLMLPIRADTMRIRTRRTELESKLAEIEEAIKIFSGKKVFVRLDS